MPTTSSHPLIEAINFYQEETNPSATVGQLALSGDGKTFRYVLAGGSTLVNGNALQSAAEDTQFKDMSVQAAVAVGATTIPVTLGSTATTANMFNGGILVISVTPGLGQVFTIVSHDVAASGTCNFNVLEPVQVALVATTSKATTMVNPYAGVIQSPSTSTGIGVGGAVHAITNAKYGWIQSGGLGGALADATATTNALQAMSRSVGTAGALTKQVSLAETVAKSYCTVSISAKVEPVIWQIDQ